jgi:hypothetical protein
MQPSPTLHLDRKKPTPLPRKHLYAIDEALWAAYKKYDRSAVMEKLVERFLAKGERTIA